MNKWLVLSVLSVIQTIQTKYRKHVHVSDHNISGILEREENEWMEEEERLTDLYFKHIQGSSC